MHTCVNPRDDVPVADLRSVFSYTPETGHIMKNGRRVGWSHTSGYRYVQIGPRQYKEHRVAWALEYGEWPKGQIDHINRVKSDNRIENLRCVTPSENQSNMPIRRDNKTGVVGVFERNGRFVATARIGGRKKHIGYFSTLQEARAAREAALN